jgi:hypothetical protein
LEAVKLGDSGVDVNVVWYDKNRLKYRMEPVDDFDGSDLRSFIHQAQDGKGTAAGTKDLHKPYLTLTGTNL